MKTWNDFIDEAKRKIEPLKDEDLRETLIFVEADRMQWAHDYYNVVHQMEKIMDTMKERGGKKIYDDGSTEP